MRIAIVGSGIAGLASAWLLSRAHEVVLFEANGYLGGHTHTHDVEQAGRPYRVDTGFIVHNPAHYPLLTRLFAELGVATQPTTMSFAVHDARSGLEYNATSLDTLFCQRRNLVSPRFLGMVRDLLRFYRQAPSLLQGDGPGPGHRRLAGGQRLRRGLPRRPPGADGLGAVVVAAGADPAVPCALPGAVHEGRQGIITKTAESNITS